MQSSEYLITLFRTNGTCSKLILLKNLCFFLLNDFTRTIRIITEAFPLVLVILRFLNSSISLIAQAVFVRGGDSL